MTLASELLNFQKSHTIKQLNILGVNWEYMVTGNDNETILMIHGGTGSAESIFKYTSAFENDYRVITPTIPTDITTVRDALTGIEAILEKENTSLFHCIGFSMGGMLEQVLLRKYPDQVQTLILFHCPVPSKSYANFIRRITRVNQIIPAWLMRGISRYSYGREFRNYPAISNEQKTFWTEYYLNKFSKERIVNQLTLVFDYLQNYHFTNDDLVNWQGKVLLFETATDTVIPENERKGLRTTYKSAQVYTFSKGSHLGNGIFMIDTTISIIKDFLVSFRQ